MEPQIIKTFIHNGQSYTIRLFIDGSSFVLKVYLDNRLIGPIYKVTLPVYYDVKRYTHCDAVSNLADLAEKDIKNNIWENWLNASNN